MARRERTRAPAASGRLEGLLAAGDHGGVRAEAARLAADPAAAEADRARAVEVVSSLAPERGALAFGAGALAVAITIAAWLVGR